MHGAATSIVAPVKIGIRTDFDNEGAAFVAEVVIAGEAKFPDPVENDLTNAVLLGGKRCEKGVGAGGDGLHPMG